MKSYPIQPMDSQSFFEKLKQNTHPVVDFWAPWCGPCKMVKPILEKLAREYDGRIDLRQINSDENQDLLRHLKVYGIPTLIIFRDGKEVQRQVGAKSSEALKSLFEALAIGSNPLPVGNSKGARLFRFGSGIIVAWVGWANGNNWLLLALGGALMFSAIYDRCPIWRTMTI